MVNLRNIHAGLFLYDCEDYHAILGLPVDAPQETIRERYLTVTRQLHPDRRQLSRPEDGPIADRLLAKLVNPAYEILYKNKAQRSEHQFVIEETAIRLSAEGGLPPLKSQAAQQLGQAGQGIEHSYRASLKALADRLYADVAQSTTLIGEISELNLVYLFYKGVPTKKKVARAAPQPSSAPQAPASSPTAAASPRRAAAPESTATQESSETAEKGRLTAMVEPYLRRAQGHLQNREYPQAVLELRDALELDSKSAACHGLLGYTYLRQNQLGMARVHTRKALQLDPQEQAAVVTQKQLDKISGSGKATGAKGKQDGGSFLGRLFGRGKK